MVALITAPVELANLTAPEEQIRTPDESTPILNFDKLCRIAKCSCNEHFLLATSPS